MARTDHTIRVRVKIPLLRIRIATLLVRAGLLPLAVRLIDGAPVRARLFGTRSWTVVGRITTAADGTASIK